MTDPTRTALSQPEPDVDDILQLAAIIRKVDGNNSLGAAALAEEILSHPHSRWTADRAQRHPAPVPTVEGEVGELIKCLRIRAASLSKVGANLSQQGDAIYFTRAADLLEQRQPVPPEPGEVQELVNWLRVALGAKRGGCFDVSTFCANLDRAAIAADRAQRQPVPPVPGEVAELVRVLHQAADNDEWDGVADWCAVLTRAAELLSQRHPQPVPVSERLPGPGEVEG